MIVIRKYVLFVILVLATKTGLLAQQEDVYIHGKGTKINERCGSCHSLRRGDPHPDQNPVEYCYRCHGSKENIERNKKYKVIPPDYFPFDISEEFTKPSHHPLENARLHHRREILPEVNPQAKRHGSCWDCHHAHKSVKKTKTDKGKKKKSTFPKLTYEYELCYKCHSYSANLPVGRKNKAIEFQTTNPSFHPVEGEGKNSNVPSLLLPYNPKSNLNCLDCHNNDDSRGPEGPHGSIYTPILNKNYTTGDGYLENDFTYALCYQCHSRQSILGNQSFPYHSLHILDKKISCYSCHNSHGSVKYTHLIEFPLGRVLPDSFGRIEFIDEGLFRGRCYLKCHEVEHSPKTY